MAKNISILRLKKIVSEYWTHGFKGVLRYFRERLVRRITYLVFENTLPVEVKSQCTFPDLTIRQIAHREDDVNKLIKFWMSHYIYSYPLLVNEKQVRELLECRLRAGEICHVAEMKGDIVFFTWACLYNKCRLNKREPLKYLNFTPRENAYVYNTFTHPKYRRQGIAFAVKKQQYKYLAELGGKKVISCIKEDNVASLNMQKNIAVHKYNLYITRFIIFNKAKLEPVREQ